MNRYPFLCGVVLFAVALGALGCGDNLTYAPVSGRVTLDSRPLAHARVTFQPIGADGNIEPGRGSFGQTDADGRYTLQVVGQSRGGAIVGKHRVEIRVTVPGSEPKGEGDIPGAAPREMIPRRFNDRSTLEMEVPPEGRSDANFDIKP